MTSPASLRADQHPAHLSTARWVVLALVGGLLAGLILIVSAPEVRAHPLGNFTRNTFAGLGVQRDTITVDYVLDLAEIPAVQTLRDIGDGDGRLSADEGEAFARGRCRQLADGLRLTVSGQTVPLQVDDVALTAPPGQAGLPTLRLECALTGAPDPLVDGTRVEFADGNLTGVAGWREITATGQGLSLRGAEVPARSLSDRLREYPQGRLQSPLDQRTASFRVAPPGADDRAGSQPSATGGGILAWFDELSGRFTALVSRQELTPGFLALAGLVAFVLGAGHAVAPGHGKTVMAAYIISREGATREALGLGLTVAVTHTFGVAALGGVLSVIEVAAPTRLFPWFGIVSGLLFAAVGLWLLWRARRSPGTGHGHHHGHEHRHDHRPLDVPAAAEGGSVGWRSLIVPGLAGGLTPTPSALVVLLGGIAIGRALFALALVFAYGLGMATTLVAAGWLLLQGRHRLARRADESRRLQWVMGILPHVTAAAVTLGGLAITARSAAAL